MESAVLQPVFDYATVDEDKRVFLQESAESIKAELKRTARGVVAIGEKLIGVKEALEHGQFLAWINAEFDDLTEMTAVRFMQVAARFGKSNILLDYPVSVLYALAAPSTPDEIVERVTSGQITPTVKAISAAKQEVQRNRNIIEEAKKRTHTPQLIPVGTQPDEEVRRQDIIKTSKALTDNAHKLLQLTSEVHADHLRSLGITGTLESLHEELSVITQIVDEVLQRAQQAK